MGVSQTILTGHLFMVFTSQHIKMHNSDLRDYREYIQSGLIHSRIAGGFVETWLTEASSFYAMILLTHGCRLNLSCGCEIEIEEAEHSLLFSQCYT